MQLLPRLRSQCEPGTGEIGERSLSFFDTRRMLTVSMCAVFAGNVSHGATKDDVVIKVPREPGDFVCLVEDGLDCT